MTEIEELIEVLKKRLGDKDFDYDIDIIEWTDPSYHHQNQYTGFIKHNRLYVHLLCYQHWRSPGSQPDIIMVIIGRDWAG